MDAEILGKMKTSKSFYLLPVYLGGPTAIKKKGCSRTNIKMNKCVNELLRENLR